MWRLQAKYIFSESQVLLQLFAAFSGSADLLFIFPPRLQLCNTAFHLYPLRQKKKSSFILSNVLLLVF